MMSGRRTEYVESLARGLAVIKAFDEKHPEMSLSEVARRAGLTPSTARRCLLTLCSMGYMRFVKKKFVLRPYIMTLGFKYQRILNVDNALVQELRKLLECFGDAASVNVLDGVNALEIAQYSKPRVPRPPTVAETACPAYLTSTGHLLLSMLPPEALDHYFRLTPPNKTNAEMSASRFHEQIQKAGRCGHSVSVDEATSRVAAIAIPITFREMEIPAALAISHYSGLRTSKPLMNRWLAALRGTASRISEILEGNPVLLRSLPDRHQWLNEVSSNNHLFER